MEGTELYTNTTRDHVSPCIDVTVPRELSAAGGLKKIIYI